MKARRTERERRSGCPRRSKHTAYVASLGAAQERHASVAAWSGAGFRATATAARAALPQ